MLIDRALQIVVHYGYIGIFALLMFGIIGLPVPDEILMTFLGFLISRKKLFYVTTVLIAFLGSITGVSLSFFIGRRLGLPFLQRYGQKIHMTPERLERVDRWFQRFGKWTVAIGYFIPGVRHFSAYSAGISRWPFRTFALYAFPGGLVWVMTFVTLGIFLGKHWREFVETLHKFVIIGFMAVLLAIGVWWMIRRMIELKK